MDERLFFSIHYLPFTIFVSLCLCGEFSLESEKEDCAATSKLIAAQPLIPKDRRNDLGGLATPHVHARGRRFYIPNSALAVGALPVSTDSVSRILALPKGNAVPLGFCCGGFSSTAGYDTGNEAQACDLSDCATSRPIISSKHDTFLSASLT